MSSSTSSPSAATAPAKRGFFSSIGPAFITAALVFGPGSIATASSMGASFGYELLWVPVIATILMLCFVNIGVRIGLTTDKSVLGTIAQRLTGIVAIIVGVGSFLVVTSFQAGNSAGTGAAGQLLFGGDPRLFAIIFTVIGLIFVWIPKFYPALEKVMIVIILVMLVAMITTAVVSKPDMGAVFTGLVPRIPEGSVPLVVGLAATTFSVVGALYQIQLIREKGWTPSDFKIARRDAVIGTLILGALSAVIMIAAAATLNPAGIEVNSPAALAQILEPIGSWAVILFAIGLWCAAFSSMIGNSTIGGTMLAGVFKAEGGGLSSLPVKICISLVIILGGIVATVFGGVPIQLIITAQAVTILAVPLIGVVMVLLARHRDRGTLRIGIPQFVLALIGLAFLVFLAANYLANFIG
ncbi:MAG: Nramp family divalent metal transporter [Candidatus Microbacterium stercoravium]|uniref:Nramp family divalent metal transporter n=1 Tax=Microbacterium sp. TaxID=51671 RepID=UPI003F969C2D